MTYDEYREKYGSRDHMLIRMSDSFPFFKEKLIVKNGEERVETNYHIADGNYSCYINFEPPEGSLAAEISWRPRFEDVFGIDHPVLVTNVGKEEFEIDLRNIHMQGSEYGPLERAGVLHPGEVFAIYPYEEAIVTLRIFNEIRVKQYLEGKMPGMLGQDEINRLLTGED